MNERRRFIKTSVVAAIGMTSAPAFGFSILKSKPRGDGELIGHGDFRFLHSFQFCRIRLPGIPLADVDILIFINTYIMAMIGVLIVNYQCQVSG